MKRTTRSWIGLLLLAIAAALLYQGVGIWIGVSKALGVSRTYDTMAEMKIALVHSLEPGPPDPRFDVVAQVRQAYPDVKVAGGAVLDWWGRPIHIEINRLPHGYSVRLAGAGADGKYGTRDDCVEEFQIDDQPQEGNR